MSDPTAQGGPPSGEQEPTYLTASWRVRLAVRLHQLDQDTAALADAPARALVQGYLTEARAGLMQPPSPKVAWLGLDIERAWQNTHAAEVALVRATSAQSATSQLPSLIEACADALPKDPRLETLKAAGSKNTTLTPPQQALLADTLQSAYAVSDAQHVQVRSFRNILLATTAVLILLAAAVALVGAFAPRAIALCDTVTSGGASCPAGAHHPTGPDVIIVEVLGLIGAAITSAVAVRKLSGTSTPYAVPLASLALKLPTGALTALLGLLLIRAGFASSITAGSQAAVAGWAVVFGAAQQVFMQFVDKQAQTVLDSVTTPSDKADKAKTKTSPAPAG